MMISIAGLVLFIFGFFFVFGFSMGLLRKTRSFGEGQGDSWLQHLGMTHGCSFGMTHGPPPHDTLV